MNTNDMAWKRGFETMYHNGDELFAIFSYNHSADYKAYQVWRYDTNTKRWLIAIDPTVSEDHAIEHINKLNQSEENNEHR